MINSQCTGTIINMFNPNHHCDIFEMHGEYTGELIRVLLTCDISFATDMYRDLNTIEYMRFCMNFIKNKQNSKEFDAYQD